MKLSRSEKGRRDAAGFSLVEMLAVLAIIGGIVAISVPQMITARRHLRNASFSREITSQLRYARQQAISGQRAVTFQYNDSTKSVTIIDHGDTNLSTTNPTPGIAWKAVMAHASYPNTPNSKITRVVSLGAIGVPANEFSYGLPTSVSLSGSNNNNKLDDGTSFTALSSNLINITFQPDGSVINSNGRPDSKVLCFYNQKTPKESAIAISVLGAAGRVKIWRYSKSANKYAE